MGLTPLGIDLTVQGFATFQSQIGRAESLVKGMSKGMVEAVDQGQRMIRTLGVLGIAAASAGAAMLGAASAAVSYALATERYAIAADTAVQVTGQSTQVLQEEVGQLNSLYVTTQSANQTLGKFAIAQVDVSQASELAAAALDLSTLSAIGIRRSYENVTEAVVNLNASRLKEFGIVTSARKIYDWYGQTLGKVSNELTTLERRQAMINYILTIASGIQGAWARSLDTASAQIEILQFHIAQLRDTFGKYLLPILAKAVTVINMFLDRILALPPGVQQTIVYVTTFAGVLLTLIGGLTLAYPAIKVFATALANVPMILSSLVKFGGGAITTLGGLTTVVSSLHPVLLAIAAAVGVMTTAIATNFGGLGDLWNRTFGSLFVAIKDNFNEILQYVVAWGLLLKDAMIYAIKVATAPIRDIIGAVLSFLDQQIRTLTGQIAQGDPWGDIFDPDRFFLGAASMMGAFAAGLLDGFTNYVLPAIIAIVNGIADFLIGLSPPRKGPLSEIDLGGLRLIEAWIDGMYKADTSKIQDLVDEVEEVLKRALWDVQDAMFDIETQALELDRALYPFQDELFMVRAAADLVTIPLNRQIRVLDRELERVEEIAAAERYMAEARLRALQKQAEELQKMIAMDQERLEVIDHEIFMEEQRLKIMGLTNSARLMQLKSQRMEVQDNVDVNQEELDVVEEQTRAERERLEELVTAAEAQAQALRDQMDALQDQVDLEEERVLLTQESLRLEEARQAQARLAITQETRFWEEEQRMVQHYLDILGRAQWLLSDLMEGARKRTKKAAEEVEKFRDLWEEFSLPEFISPETERKTSGFFAGVQEKLAALKGAFMEQLQPAIDRFRERMGELQKAWERLTIVVELKMPDIWSILSDPIVSVWTAVTNWIVAKWTTTTAWIQRQWGITVAWLESQGLTEWWARTIVPIMRSTWNEAMEFIRRSSSQTVEFIQQVWDNLPGFFSSLWSGITTFFSNLWRDVVGFFSLPPEEMGRALARAVLSILNFMIDVKNTVVDVISTMKTIVFGIIEDIVVGIVNIFLTMDLKEIAILLGKIVILVVRTLAKLLIEMAKIGLKIVSLVLETISTISHIIQTKFLDFLVNFVGPFLFGFLDELTGGMISRTVDWIVESTAKVVEFIEDILSKAEQFGSDVLSWLTTFASDTLTEWITMFAHLVTETVIGLAHMLAEFVRWLYVDMPKFWEDAKVEFNKRLRALFDSIKEWFKSTGIPEMIQHGKDVIANFIRSAEEWISDKRGRIKDIGKSIVSSIWDGMKDRWDWARRKVREFVDGLIKAAKSKLKIVGDPYSIVFRGVGDTMAASLGEGFMRGMEQWTPRMAYEMMLPTQVQGFTSSQAQQVVNNTTTYGPTYNVTAHYANRQTEGSIRDDLRMMVALR